MGLVGRLKYDYANRYYIEGSFRYDGSDNFAPGHRWDSSRLSHWDGILQKNLSSKVGTGETLTC